MIVCVHNWPEILAEYIASKQAAPFLWGKNDCCLFACDGVFEMTGFDLAIDFRGKYNDLPSAIRVMREFTGKEDVSNLVDDVATKIARVNDIQEITPLMAQRGDIVLVAGELGASLAIVGNSGAVAHGAGMDGMVSVPMSGWLTAWRIPKA